MSFRKEKGDIYVPGRYIGNTLLNQDLKLFERIVEARVMRIVWKTQSERTSWVFGKGEELTMNGLPSHKSSTRKVKHVSYWLSLKRNLTPRRENTYFSREIDGGRVRRRQNARGRYKEATGVVIIEGEPSEQFRLDRNVC